MFGRGDRARPVRPTANYRFSFNVTSRDNERQMESAGQPVSKHQPNGVVTHKRRRVINSCTECRRRKVKCDRNKPCAQCVTNQSSDLCQFFDAVPTSTQDESERQHEHRQTDDNSVRILGVSSTAGPSPASSTPTGQFHGSISKTRVYGHGHWMDPSSVVISSASSIERFPRVS